MTFLPAESRFWKRFCLFSNLCDSIFHIIRSYKIVRIFFWYFNHTRSSHILEFRKNIQMQTLYSNGFKCLFVKNTKILLLRNNTRLEVISSMIIFNIICSLLVFADTQIVVYFTISNLTNVSETLVSCKHFCVKAATSLVVIFPIYCYRRHKNELKIQWKITCSISCQKLWFSKWLTHG